MKTPLKHFLALALVSCATTALAGMRVQYFVGYGLYPANSPDTMTTAPGSGLLAVNGSHRALIQLISAGPNHADDGLDVSNPGGGYTAGDDVLLDSRILEEGVDGVDEWGYTASIPPPFVSTNSPSVPLFVRVHQNDTLSEDPHWTYDSPLIWPDDLSSDITNPPADVMATVIHIESGSESPPMTGVALGDSGIPTNEIPLANNWYVATNGNDSAAGTNWATAKLTIQAAVDAAADGNTVWVSNGVYAAGGGRPVVGTWANRVAIDKPVVVQSVHGPETTFISGGGMRCAYVVNGAVLSGFTLTNGATARKTDPDAETTIDHKGGGAACEVSAILTNCILTGNWACEEGAGSVGGILNNCMLIGNSTWNWGGGSSGGTLNHCTLVHNHADMAGGGSLNGTLNDCTLASNTTSYGGGSIEGSLNRCILKDNIGGSEGGGAFGGTLNQCILSGNQSMKGGGAARGANLNHCLITGNWASAGENEPGMRGGGGANSCQLNNCTVVGNSAFEGGGIMDCAIFNSIVYGNSATEAPNWRGGSFTNSCTTPDPGGTGNITADPQFVDAAGENYRLQSNSPCLDAGNNAYVQGTADLDGNPRIANGTVDMGAYEVQPPVAPALTIAPASTNLPADAASGRSIQVTANVSWMATTNASWLAITSGASGATNGTVVFGAALNNSASSRTGAIIVAGGGISRTCTVIQAAGVVLAPNWYVATNGNDAAAGTNWATAKRTIQAGVDAAINGNAVWVSNGVYSGAGNRDITFRGKAIEVRGLHGPSNTVVDCQHNGRGFVFDSSETAAAVLSGFTIQNGHAVNGGGISCSARPTIEDCVILSNQVLTTSGAPYSRSGAGIYVGGAGANPTIRNCRILFNDADRIAPVPGVSANGGGIAVMAGASALIESCEVAGNRVMYGGGGIYIEGPGVTVRNCLIQSNECVNWGGGVHCQYDSTTNKSRLVDCLIKGNTSLDVGGGVATFSGLVLEHCTLYGNYGWRGGGIWNWPGSRPQFQNSIVWSNTAGWAGPQFYGGDSETVFSYCCCATLTPAPGSGNITNDPRYVDAAAGNYRLLANSPCVDAGNNAYVSETTDLDGNPRFRNGTVDMGAYELQAGSVSALAISPASTNLSNGAASGRTIAVTANVSWTATTNVPWLAITSGFSGATNGTVVFGAAANGVTSARTGAVIVAGGGISRTCTVIQAAGIVLSPNWYVATNGNDSAAGTNWATAKRTIQAAIDAATNGNTVWVSNGVYATGGRVTGYLPSSSNRVVLDKALTVRSVNGPAATHIRGANDPSAPDGFGDAAVRCAFVGAGAVLSGFTLTNGATATYGGSAFRSYGGGVVGHGLVSHCTLIGNAAYKNGGGAYGDDLTLSHCALIGNSAATGGGSSGSTLNNCEVAGNTARYNGGGSFSGTLNNCTVAGNTSGTSAGGSFYGTLNNCIVFANTAPVDPNYRNSIFNFSCTMPAPGGTGNFAGDPQFAAAAAGDYRLGIGSPCIDAGDNAYSPGTADLDGNPRIVNGTVDMGAYECQRVLAIAPATLQLTAGPTNGRTIDVTANTYWVVTGDAEWIHVVSGGSGLGDTTMVFNVAANFGMTSRTATLVFAASGVSRTCTVVQAGGDWFAADWHVATNGNDAASGATWATAKQTIQAAIDAAADGDTVWVSNGVYAAGGRPANGSSLSNRVWVHKPVVLRSVNGPEATTIQGAWDPAGANGCGEAAVRCVYLCDNALLNGFTLAQGATRMNSTGDDFELVGGGGVYGEYASFVEDCILTGNAAIYGGGAYGGRHDRCKLVGNSASIGGGAFHSALTNSLLSDNTAGLGGGTYQCNLNNCTVVGNTAGENGGGTADSQLHSCIEYFNTATSGSNIWRSTYYKCCVAGNPPINGGNITNDPRFADAPAGDFHLSFGSPCIDAGDNGDVQSELDLDGNPRVENGIADMGAYEFQRSLEIDPASIDLSSRAASGLTIGVAANVDWTAATTSAWISITGGSSGSGDGAVTYAVATNSGVARAGTITVSGGNRSRTFTVNQAPREISLLWEDFESYAAGLWPSARWFADANAADAAHNRVLADPTRGGNQVLQMQGVVGGAWAALGYRSVALPADFWVEGKVWNGTETLPDGSHPLRSGIHLRQGAAWTSYSRPLLSFHKSGQVLGGDGAAIGAYAAGTWQTCKVHYVRSGTTVELSTWLNGQALGTASIAGVNAANEAALSRLGLEAGAGTALFDDLRVYHTPATYTYYRDADGDGFGDPGNTATGTDLPAGHVCDNTDWNDLNASVHPGAPEVPDGVDNNGDWQIDEGARVAKTCFALNQSIACAGSGWSRAYILDLTNYQDIAAQDGYQNFTVEFLLYYNIWTGIYLYDYTAGAFGAVGWMVNLDL